MHKNSTISKQRDAIASIPDGSVPLESVLCTEELHRRPSRRPDYEKENGALVKLAQALADSPHTILQTLTDTILEVLEAGSAGISLLTTHDGGKRFHWPAIAGVWKSHIGGGTPRDFGPCGDVLDRNQPLMFRHVERRYTYFAPVEPPVEEALLVPFYVEGKAVGTIWAIAHDMRRQFDAEDLRQLLSLGRFASAAYEVWMSLDAVGQLAAIVESSEDAIISKDLNGVIISWNNGAERLFGYTAQEAIGQPVIMLMPPERVDEEPGIIERIRRGERIEHYETIRRRKDGRLLDISLTVSPIMDSQGKIIGASKIARDITERKRTEAELQTLRRELESRVEKRTSELRAAHSQLVADIAERKRLEAEVTQAVEAEQRRLGQELHDGVAQEMVGVGLMLDSLANKLAKSSPTNAREAKRLRELLARAGDNARNLAKGFYPVDIQQQGLLAALQTLARRTEESFGVSCTVKADKRLASQLKDARAFQLFRIAQEAVHNAAKHAKAKHIHVRLTAQNGDWIFTVKDDGVGMRPDPQHQVEGMGLRIMDYRARVIGGTLSVRNDDGGGVIVSCVAPAITLQPETAHK